MPRRAPNSFRPSCGPALRKKKNGTFPYIVVSLRNFDSIIPYFNVTFYDGSRRRAWLMPPEYTGQPAHIRLESTDMSLGCDGSPQTATLETNEVGVNVALPQGSAVLLRVYNKCLGKTWRLGCSESTDGKITYDEILPGVLDTCLAATPSNTWFVLTTTNLFQQYVYSGVTLLCRTRNGRVLRALPTLSSDIYELAWREPASPEGFDVDLTAVLDTVCLACDRASDAILDSLDAGCCSPVYGPV